MSIEKSKSKAKEVNRLLEILKEVKRLNTDFRFSHFDNIGFYDYEIFGTFENDTAEDFLKELISSLSEIDFESFLLTPQEGVEHG